MKILAVLFMFTSLNSVAATLTPDEIMKRNENARKLGQLQAKGKIIIDGGSRRGMEKTFSWWRQIQEDGVHFNTLTKFHTPANVKDQAILFLEAKDEKNEILMYLPTFKKTRIIESSQQNSSFMASDFSYSDITALQNEDYVFTDGSLAPCPNEKGECHKVLAVPKNPKSIERLGYSKIDLWIRTDTFMVDRIFYYDKNGKHFKQLDAGKVVQISKDTYFPQHLKMQNLLNGQFTVIEFSDIDAKTSIPKSRFFKQKLGKDG